jgi:hypothetical protein
MSRKHKADPPGTQRLDVSMHPRELEEAAKTAARGFDRYKGHIAIDPDAEIITAAEVTAATSAMGA